MSEAQLPMLPAWLDADAASLSGAVAPAASLIGALPGLARAQSMTPLQRLQRVQQSGLGEWGAAGEPIHLAWRRFLRAARLAAGSGVYRFTLSTDVGANCREMERFLDALEPVPALPAQPPVTTEPRA